MIKLLTIVLPAYNEELSIQSTLQDYHSYFPDAFFIVVDNNSNDKTASLSSNYLKSNNIDGVVIYEAKKGKANAVKTAFNFTESIWWIMADADMTYPAKDMFQLYKKLQKSNYDHGILNRLKGNHYISDTPLKTVIHKIGNKFFSKLISRLSGVNISDAFSGGRIFTSPFIETFVINTNGFELESEINFHSSLIRANIIEHDCEIRKRGNNNPSKLNTFLDGYKILKLIFKLFIHAKLKYLSFVIGAMLIMLGIFFSLKLLAIYLNNGEMNYSSTAVMTSIFLITGFQLVIFSIILSLMEKNKTEQIRLKFNSLKKKWHMNLFNKS